MWENSALEVPRSVHKQHGANWPVVGRDDELGQALAAFEVGAQVRGVALLGESGVGKSALARSLAEVLASRGHAVRFVLGTETGRAIPLGAFYRSVTVDATHEPAVMLAAAHRTLEQEENLVMVVDDAQLLDSLSATLVHQLAVSGKIRLIVVVRTGDPVPDAVTSLWKEQLLQPLAIKPFGAEQIGELARAVLGGAVNTDLVDELHHRTAGNVLLLRGLLSAGRESGVLVQTGAGWQLRGPLRGDDELYDLVEFRLQSLTPEELEAVEVVATAEVLDWQVLQAICDAHAIAALERRGLLQLVGDGAPTMARLNHPVIGEAAVRRAGIARTRQLNTILAQQLQRYTESGVSPADVRTRMQLAQFMMHGDLEPDLDLIIETAATAITMSNVGYGEELARFAFDHGGGLAAALVLADAVSWQGRGSEAENVLRSFDPDGSDVMLTVRWGCLRAANLFWGCGRLIAARAVLANVKERVDPAAVLGLASSMEVSFAFFSGDLPTAITTGLVVCESDLSPPAAVWAAMSTSWALGLSGRFAECHRFAHKGFQAASLGDSGPHRFAIGLAEMMALTAAGDFAGTDLVRDRYAELAAGVREAEAIVKAIAGVAYLARGDLVAASEALHESVAAMLLGFPSGFLMLVSAMLAQAQAGQQHSDVAASALHLSEDANGPQVTVFLPELELARAWVKVAGGQTSSARRHAMRAADIARQSGMAAVEIRALHTAVRFGDRSQAPRIVELARRLEAPLPEAMAAHARALAYRDGELLDEVAERFSGIGAMGLAADAAAQAAREHARAGARAKGLESSARAHWLAGKLGLHSPALAAATQPLPITDREREIAAMVSAGMSNREIANRLSVSVRTVDGHLYRIYAKLDIQSRDQLARLIRPAESGA